jgi:colanic acid/amylovoran biosynthesis glycosyltransferase
MFLRDIGALRGALVTTFHGADLTQSVRAYGPTVYRHLFRSGDLFLPISETWRQKLIDLGCPNDKIRVHHMGISCKEFKYRPRHKGDSGITQFVSVCRLVEKKGIEFAIRAIAAVARTGRRLRYDVIGDGPLRFRLEGLIAELGMADIVTIHGSKTKSEVVTMLDCAHVLLAPSVTAEDGDREGIPVAIMEAMAVGLPVISTRHSGIPELVRDGSSGYLVEERDVDALASKIAEMVDHPEVWIEMGRAGRGIVERDFDIGLLNDHLATELARIASAHNRGH